MTEFTLRDVIAFRPDPGDVFVCKLGFDADEDAAVACLEAMREAFPDNSSIVLLDGVAIGKEHRWAAFTDDELDFIARGGAPHGDLNYLTEEEWSLLHEAKAELERRRATA